MGRSSRLRLAEVKEALRLVGECRDFGNDPAGWLGHAMHGVQRLLQAKVVTAAITPPQGYHLNREAALLLDVGLEEPGRRQLARAYLAGERQLEEPTFQRFQRLGQPNVTVRPARLVTGREADADELARLRSRVLGVGDFLFSQRQAATKTVAFGFAPHRAYGDRPYTARDTRLLALLHDELARLVGTVLAERRGDSGADLPPRLRQTLQALLQGDSEKQAALRLGLSRHTVHEYVMELYRRFGVHTRAELLALCLARTDQGRRIRGEDKKP